MSTPETPLKEEKGPAIKPGWLRAVLLLLAYIVVAGVFQILGMGLAYLLTDIPPQEIGNKISEQGSIDLLVIIQGASLVGTLLLVGTFRKLIDRKTFGSLGFRMDLSGFSGGIILGVALIGIGLVTLSGAGYLDISSVEFHEQQLFLHLILTAMIAVNEELLVRGYLLQNLMNSVNKYLALAISALIFMVLHSLNPNISWIAIMNLFLAGILLGITYIHTKNLWFPIGLHLSWNFAQGPLFGFNVSGMDLANTSLIKQKVSGPDHITGGEFGFEGSLILSILLLICIIFLGLFYPRK